MCLRWKLSVLFVATMHLAYATACADGQLPTTKASQQEDASQIRFSRDVAPLLAQYCLECHNADLPEGGFRVDSFEQLMSPSDSGLAVDRDSPGESELLNRVRTDDTSLRMPLDGEPLPNEQIEKLEAWLQQGASFDGSDPAMDLNLLLPPPTYDPPPQLYAFPIAITALEFSEDGSQLFVGGYHEVLLWNWQTQKLVRRIDNAPERITSILSDGVSHRLYVAGGQPGRRGEVRSYDADTGELINVPFVGSDVVWDIALAPLDRRLAVAGADRQLVVLDLQAEAIVRRFSVHSDWVVDVAWDHDGHRLSSASRDQSAKVFDIRSGELLANYPEHESEVRGVSFLFRPDEDEEKRIDDIISVDVNGRVDRWRAKDAQRKKRQTLSDKPLFPAIMTADGFILVDSHGEVWRSDDGFELIEHPFDSLEQPVTSVAYDLERHLLACGLSDGTVVLRSPKDPEKAIRFQALPMESSNASAEFEQ